MLTASRRAGFSDEELIVTGLAQRSQNRPGQIYDRFRERIMFPSTDARGNVIGFGARAMRDNQRPKYLNTAEGELYHKRRVLFGLDRARAAAARIGNVILVEGYTDVLALHQAGLCPTPSGSWAPRSPRSRSTSSSASQRCSCCVSTPTAPARTRCSGPPRSPTTGTWSCESSRCPKGPIRPS